MARESLGTNRFSRNQQPIEVALSWYGRQYIMKTSLLSRAAVGCVLALTIGGISPTISAPVTPPATEGMTLPANKMPAEVRALMPHDGKTTKLALFPIGAHGAPILLHAWTIERGFTNGYAPALFCMDLFYRDKPNVGQWQLGSSISYVHEESGYPPGPSYTMHWLHPATKQGVVIAEETFQMTGSTIRLITLPDGVPMEAPSDRDVYSVQKFFTSTSGGFSSIDFAVNASGTLTVEQRLSTPTPYPGTLNTFAWRQGRWIKVASRQFKRG